MRTLRLPGSLRPCLVLTLLLVSAARGGRGIGSSSSSPGGSTTSGGSSTGSSNPGNTGEGSSGNSTGTTYIYSGTYTDAGGVAGFSQDGGGTLSPVPGSPFSQPGLGTLGAMAATKGYLYGANLVDSTSKRLGLA